VQAEYAEQSLHQLDEEGIVNGRAQLDVAHVSGAVLQLETRATGIHAPAVGAHSNVVQTTGHSVTQCIECDARDHLHNAQLADLLFREHGELQVRGEHVHVQRPSCTHFARFKPQFLIKTQEQLSATAAHVCG